ncbi:hypothetical protein PF003_g8777 [Phytophthora fragariae]|nr:hypothetical protein PF003_g8777 [Phytophthora fragariae]
MIWACRATVVAVVVAGEPDGNDITTVDGASGQALSAERLRQGARQGHDDQEVARGPRPGGSESNGESAAMLAFDGDRDARKHAVRAATIGSSEVVDGVSMDVEVLRLGGRQVLTTEQVL